MPRRSVAPTPPIAPARGVVPGWFGAVMGTGVLAVVLEPRLPALALGCWVLAASLLGLLTVAMAVQERSYVDHPVQQHFFGAPAMAAMTVGAGALVTQGDTAPVVLMAAALWVAGTTLGVVTAVGVPRRTAGTPLADVGPWWLMPVVPPTVSATTGALLVPHLPSGAVRTAFVLLCYALLALSVVGTVRVLRLLARRVAAHGFGPAATAPAWLIVLGPLGQSVTAVHHLGEWSGLAPLTPYVGAPVLAAALVWLAVAAAVVVRARPPFGLTWWACTFPVATVVTGTTALGWSAVAGALTVALLAAWTVVAAGSVRGVRDGSLLVG